MMLRMIGAGMAGLLVATAASAAAGGAGVVLLACAARRCAKARTAWPAEKTESPVEE